MSQKIITLITDFGTVDSYVASMKGVILSICPDCKIVDITHNIEPQQILQASIVLATSAPYFPINTIHLAIVDPDVGTDRPLLAVQSGGHTFVAPDNGLLGFIFRKKNNYSVRRIQNDQLFMTDISQTFHGRDILAPVAGHLATGKPFELVGAVTHQYIKKTFPNPIFKSGILKGEILYRDHFGNLMTNIRRDDIQRIRMDAFTVRTGYTKISGLSNSYSDVEKGELLCLFGSSGYLEIALREGSASDKLRFPIGTAVEISEKSTGDTIIY